MKLKLSVQDFKAALQGYLELGQKSFQILKSEFRKEKVVTSEVPVSKLCCDFGQSKLVLLELQKVSGAVCLVRFQKISQPREPEKRGEVLKQCFESGKFSTNKVRISVKGQGVIVRFVQFPKMKPEELRSAIIFEAEKYIPFKANEVVIDFQVLDDPAPGTDSQINLLLVSVKREEIYPIIQVVQSAGMEIELIDIDALAFVNALEFFYPEILKSSVGILDIGSEISTLSVIREGKPRFIRDISYGGVDITKRLKRKLGISDEQALEQMEVDRVPSPEAAEVLKEGLGNLVADLKVSLDYYLDQVHPSEPVTKLFLGGGGGYHPIVVETLTKDLGFSVETIDVLSKFKLAEGVDPELIKKNQGLLPVALGLGLRDL